MNTQKGWVKTAKEDFLKTWQGIALLAETSSESGEKNFTEKRKNEALKRLRIPSAISLLMIVISIFIIPILTNFSSPLFLAFVLLKIVGMIASGLLLVKSIDGNNELVDKVCNNGPKMNCQSILDSPAAYITSWLNWFDLGFIYCFGSFLALLFGLYSNTLIAFLVFNGFFVRAV